MYIKCLELTAFWILQGAYLTTRRPLHPLRMLSDSLYEANFKNGQIMQVELVEPIDGRVVKWLGQLRLSTCPGFLGMHGVLFWLFFPKWEMWVVHLIATIALLDPTEPPLE